MIDQTREAKPKKEIRNSGYIESAIVGSILLFAMVLLLVACGAPSSTPPEVVVQTALATPTLEPTFTPLAASTPTPQSSPKATLPEPTPAATPQSVLSGRILDQDTDQPVAGAEVRAGTASTITDADGRYTLTGLPPGQYVLSVTHPDYDPGLSGIFTLTAGQELSQELTLYAPDTSPYPKEPMLTNPLDPTGAPTAEDAERLARLQGLTGEVVDIWGTKLSGEYLVNYKIGEGVRAAVAELNHEVWVLTDDTGRLWWIIKVCGNLASLLPEEAAVATPQPRPLSPMAEVVVDDLSVRACAAKECAEVGIVQLGARVEVIGCLGDGSWCQVGLPGGGSGWCTGRSLRHRAAAEAVPVVEAILPTAAPGVVTTGKGKIIFRSNRDGEWKTYVMNADGSEVTPLTSYPAVDSFPALSPDGQQIAFVSKRDDHEGQIYLVNVDGSGLRLLLDQPNPVLAPIWSPDGQRIAFVGKHDSNLEIYVMNADGSHLVRLTDHPAIDTDPSWSPDGQQIAFTSSRDGAFDVYVMNADGSGVTRLTNAPNGDLAAGWSPNGEQIVFWSLRDGNPEIYVMNADGTDQTRLTYDEDSDQFPSWSPDGQKIAFESRRNDNVDVYVMNADGSDVTRLTNHPAQDVGPVWLR